MKAYKPLFYRVSFSLMIFLKKCSMKNMITIAVVILLLTLWSCKKDSSSQIGKETLYIPIFYSIRNNGEIILKWKKPICPACCGCPQLDPDRFEIFMSSTSPSDLKFYRSVENDIFEISISNLTNETPYYFAIRAVRRNLQFTDSDTIMTIPDNPENIQSIFQSINKNKEYGTWSNDQTRVAYMSDYIWNDGNNSATSILITNLSNNEELLVETFSNYPEWSPTGQKIVYVSYNSQGNSLLDKPQISVFNIQESKIKRLTNANSFFYDPSWSADGKWLAFISDLKVGSGGMEYNIWKIPSDSGTAVPLVIDYKDSIDIGIPKYLNWSKDGKDIAFTLMKKSNEKHTYAIYSVPSDGGNKSTIISSQWSDFCPAYSPDGNTIAFISNRSGLNEIWTMNLRTKKLRQITGSTEFKVSEGLFLGKIEWSTSGNRILFTGNNEGSFLSLYAVDVN